jgi:hypothetical protein
MHIDGGFDRRNAMVEKLVEKLWLKKCFKEQFRI